ncbi:MAG: FAD-binding oxidoreductase [Betaproteobacteria bacterium]
MSYDIAGLTSALGAIPSTADAGRLRNKSRDYYWYSPVLREQLDAVRADLAVLPETEADVIATLGACHARKIPVTVRGAGTGNYGQAMPLAGGVVLDLSELRTIRFIRRGVARAMAGVRLSDLDGAARADSGQEQRMHPSTLRSATLGGFICGGSGGVGSITWGGLRDRGNVLGARVLTMEASPRVIELRGDDVQKVIHAYGTTGVVTEVEIALAQAQDWVDVIVGFDELTAATRFAYALACQDALLKKLASVLAAPIAERYLRPVATCLGPHRHAVLTMIAAPAMAAFTDFVGRWPGKIVYRSEPDGDDDGSRPTLLPVYEYAWNHTTLHALKTDRAITYHQTLYPTLGHVERAAALFPQTQDELMHHLEFVRFDGGIACYGLPLIRYTSAARLAEIAAVFEQHGCPTFSPHTVTLEGGGMKRVDPVQLAFKRETDPLGLLNPGKMRGWDDPDHGADSGRVHLFPATGDLAEDRAGDRSR